MQDGLSRHLTYMRQQHAGHVFDLRLGVAGNCEDLNTQTNVLYDNMQMMCDKIKKKTLRRALENCRLNPL